MSDTAGDTDDEIIKLIKEDITEIKKIADNIGNTEFDEMIIQQIQDINTTGFIDYAHNLAHDVNESQVLEVINSDLTASLTSLTSLIDTPQLYNFYIVIKRLVDNFKTFLIIKTTYNNNKGLFGGIFQKKDTLDTLYYGYCANAEDRLNNIIKQIDDKGTDIIETITNHKFFDYETFSNQFGKYFKLADKYYKNWEKGKSLTKMGDDVLIHKETKYETPYPKDEEMLKTFNALNKTFTDNTLMVKKNNTVLIWKKVNSVKIKETYMNYINKFKEFIERDLNFEGGLNLSEDDASIQKLKELKETLSDNDKKNAFFLIECIKEFNIIKNLTERIVTIFLTTTTSETTTSENITTKIETITKIAKPLIDKIETLYTGNKIYIINALNREL